MSRSRENMKVGVARTYAHKHFTLSSHTTHIHTALFGSTFADEQFVNWSLAGLQKSGDEAKPANSALVRRLKDVALAYNVQTLWAPNPTQFNGIITDRSSLTEHIPLSETISLYRGAYADGVELGRDEALILSTGGCPLITITHDDHAIAAHAGLKCLFDFDKPDRKSVVTNAIEYLDIPKCRSGRPIYVQMDFSIHPDVYEHPWDHPEWGQKNEMLCRELEHRWGPSVLVGDRHHGRIDLIALAQQQLLTHNNCVFSTSSTHLPPVRGEDASDVHFYHTRMRSPYNTMRNLTVSARV